MAARSSSRSRRFLRTAVRLVPFIALGCGGVGHPVPANVLRDPTNPYWSQHAPPTFRVRFQTTKGDFVIQVTRAMAPIGVDRFYNLVRAGFYDDSRFFRVRTNYIAMFGDPAIWQSYGFTMGFAAVTVILSPGLKTSRRPGSNLSPAMSTVPSIT